MPSLPLPPLSRAQSVSDLLDALAQQKAATALLLAKSAAEGADPAILLDALTGLELVWGDQLGAAERLSQPRQ